MLRISYWALVALFAGSLTAASSVPEGQGAALQNMHNAFVEAFVDSDGFGAARIPPMLAKMRRYEMQGVGGGDQCVRRAELIGVARHAEPVVHLAGLSGPLHRGSSGAAWPPAYVRALTQVEAAALAELRAGAPLTLYAAPGEFRLMGPIDARADCLRCHTGAKEGQLLGALSYSLGRLQAPKGGADIARCV